MIKLIKEFLHTGIAAHKKSIEASNKIIESANLSISGWRTSIKCNDYHSQLMNLQVYNGQVNRNIRIERLGKKKKRTSAENDQLKSDMLVHNYCEERDLNVKP